MFLDITQIYFPQNQYFITKITYVIECVYYTLLLKNLN